MKNVIVNSSRDPAGSNIRDRLIEDFGFTYNGEKYEGSPVYQNHESTLISIREEIIFAAEELDHSFPDARYIFISKHRSESGIPSLTAHFTGNFAQNDFGGRPREIARFSPSLLKHYFTALHSIREEIPKMYNLTLEATHHGPTSLKNTVLFVELGSGPAQWDDLTVARSIAKALLQSLREIRTFESCAIAFGGTHYPQKFNMLILEGGIALGPIVPKYSLQHLDEEMMEQLVTKGDQKITHAALDMKGLSSFKEKVVKLVSEFGLEIVRV